MTLLGNIIIFLSFALWIAFDVTVKYQPGAFYEHDIFGLNVPHIENAAGGMPILSQVAEFFQHQLSLHGFVGFLMLFTGCFIGFLFIIIGKAQQDQ